MTDLHSATPVELIAALEKCDLLRYMEGEHVIQRFRWAVDSSIEGYIDKQRSNEEVALFRKTAEALIAKQMLLEMLRRTNAPLTAQEEERRREWLEQLAQQATRREIRLQRKRLRDGHTTLTAIRRVLRGADPYPQQASTPEKTSLSS